MMGSDPGDVNKTGVAAVPGIKQRAQKRTGDGKKGDTNINELKCGEHLSIVIPLVILVLVTIIADVLFPSG